MTDGTGTDGIKPAVYRLYDGHSLHENEYRLLSVISCHVTLILSLSSFVPVEVGSRAL